MRECSWRKEKRAIAKDPELSAILKRVEARVDKDFIFPAKARSFLHGGRTEAGKLYHQFKKRDTGDFEADSIQQDVSTLKEGDRVVLCLQGCCGKVQRLCCCGSEAFSCTYDARYNCRFQRVNSDGTVRIEFDHLGMYYDIASLYPDRMFHCPLPIGHVEIIKVGLECFVFDPEKESKRAYRNRVVDLLSEYSGNREEDECIQQEDATSMPRHLKWYGGMHCTVDPPQGKKQLRFPVLGSSTANGRFTFDLCQGKRDCWFTPEIKRAVELGYTITAIHEFHRFAEQDADMFKGFITVCTAGKDHASGDRDMTKEEIEAHVAKYAAIGITINPAKLKTNKGLRTVFKLVLNAAGFGKLCQRGDMSEVRIVETYADLMKIIENARYDRNTIQKNQIGEDRLEVIYQTNEAFVRESDNSCVYAGGMITCWARLKLHEQLHRLGDQLSYFDTDSGIFDSAPGLKMIKEGTILGEWTDENDYDGIRYYLSGEFVSAGAKTYAYRATANQDDFDRWSVEIDPHSPLLKAGDKVRLKLQGCCRKKKNRCPCRGQRLPWVNSKKFDCKYVGCCQKADNACQCENSFSHSYAEEYDCTFVKYNKNGTLRIQFDEKRAEDMDEDLVPLLNLPPIKETTKCAGFTLNWTGSQAINFDTMKDLVLGEVRDIEGNLLEEQKLELRAYRINVDPNTRQMYNYVDEEEQQKPKEEQKQGMKKKMICEYTKGEMEREYNSPDGKEILTGIRIVPYGWNADTVGSGE
jgi:hypothetical protein